MIREICTSKTHFPVALRAASYIVVNTIKIFGGASRRPIYSSKYPPFFGGASRRPIYSSIYPEKIGGASRHLAGASALLEPVPWGLCLAGASAQCPAKQRTKKGRKFIIIFGIQQPARPGGTYLPCPKSDPPPCPPSQSASFTSVGIL